MNYKPNAKRRRRSTGPRFDEEAMIDCHLANFHDFERIKRTEGQAAADAAAKRNGWRLPQDSPQRTHKASDES